MTLVEMIEALQKEFPHLSIRETYHRLGSLIAAAREQQEQHSADLREVAELASLAGKTYGQQSERYMNGEVSEQPDWPTPDSIVRGFREKQQKAEVKAQ